MLFEVALAETWQALPEAVRDLHGDAADQRFEGCAEVIRGASVAARLAQWIVGFPKAGQDVPLSVTMTRDGAQETWLRDFDGQRFCSHLSPSDRPFHCYERFGPLACELALNIEDQILHLKIMRGRFLGLPVPKLLLPVTQAREFERDGRFHFDVALYAPLGLGIVVHYRGWLAPIS